MVVIGVTFATAKRVLHSDPADTYMCIYIYIHTYIYTEIDRYTV